MIKANDHELHNDQSRMNKPIRNQRCNFRCSLYTAGFTKGGSRYKKNRGPLFSVSSFFVQNKVISKKRSSFLFNVPNLHFRRKNIMISIKKSGGAPSRFFCEEIFCVGGQVLTFLGGKVRPLHLLRVYHMT